MNRKIIVLLIFASFLFAGKAFPAAVTLSDTEGMAVNYSPRLKSLLSEQRAFEERAFAQKTQLYPKFTFDGTYRYVTTVQEMSVPLPGFKPIKLGDNPNYSIGPALNWNAWDSGSIKNTHMSASAAAEAKKLESDAAKVQLIFAVRNAYFNVALTNEQVALYSDALKLVDSQYQDIKVNVKAGTKSRADELKSHQEVLVRMRLLRQAKADLSSALRDLNALAGTDISGASLESIDVLLSKFEPYENVKFNANHPNLAALTKYAESASYSKRAAGSLYWPRLQLSAKSTLDYPNGPVLERYNQNTVAAAFSWALFESGATKNRVNESAEQSKSFANRRDQLESDLKRDWDKASEQLSSLKDQRQLNDISVLECDELSSITYKAYKAGSVSFIEVENANFKALEAKIQSARTKVQMLTYLAMLASMAQ